MKIQVSPKTILIALFAFTATLLLSNSQLASQTQIQTIKPEQEALLVKNTKSTAIKRTNSRSDKIVAITIDDGYGEIDPVLDVLKSHRVKATFFMLGEIAEKNPEAMQRIVNEGHLLANHSYNHPEFTTLTHEEILWQLEEGRNALLEASGYDPHPYFRYPYGSQSITTNAILSEQGWEPFYWTQNTWDWMYEENTEEGAEFIYQEAIKDAPDESIVLLHTQSQSTISALPDIIKWYRRQGYDFVTVGEL